MKEWIPEIENNIIKDLQELDEYGNYKYTQKYIAYKYNVSGATVSRIAKNEVLRNKKINPKTRNNIIKDLQELDKNGKYKYTYKDIANKHRVSIRNVSTIAKEENLSRYNNRKINTKTRDNIIKDLKEIDDVIYKYTYKDIADKYNLSANTISKIAKEENINRGKGKKINPKTRDNIIKDLQELDDYGIYKYTQQEIADRYNVSKEVVIKSAKEENLSRDNNRKINPKTRNNIIKDLKEIDDYGIYKYTYQEIADKYNLSIRNISIIAEKENINRGKGKKINPKTRNNIIKDLKETDGYGNYKYTQKYIAYKYNVSRATISRIIEKESLIRHL